MSPTIFIYEKYRFFFFSREESRMHVHVNSSDGEAKFWLEPVLALSESYGFSKSELKYIQAVIENNHEKVIKAWKKHFKS